MPFGSFPFSVFRFPKSRWKACGLLFVWKRVYLLAIDLIATSFGNRLGFVSGCKISAFFREKTLSVKKRFFFNLVERQLESHAELGGEQWVAEGNIRCTE